MEINDGEKFQRHLCEDCARKEGITVKAQAPVSEMLNNLVMSQSDSEKISDLRCPQCDVTWSDFRKSGMLGCPNDYLAFEKPLKALIERAQGKSSQHAGKVPKQARNNFGQQVHLLRLRQDLQNAVDTEDYEAAARLRDEISKVMPN